MKTIAQLNAEIKRLTPIASELYRAKEVISKPATDKWLAVAFEIERLEKERLALIEQITSDTAVATA